MSDPLVKIPGNHFLDHDLGIHVRLSELKALIAKAEQPTFQVGQWVTVIATQLDSLLGVTAKLTAIPGKETNYYQVPWKGYWTARLELKEIRPATPEEIAAATRITPKVGMLLKRKTGDSCGSVFLVVSAFKAHAHILPVSYIGSGSVPASDLSTEVYDVLDAYTIQGAQ